jgi:hypothetical protein
MTATAKHTPGPWRINVENCLMVDSADDCIALCNLARSNAADALLIAAAPDLYRELAHLVRLLEPLERNGGMNVPGLASLNGARSAIAKVEGGAA